MISVSVATRRAKAYVLDAIVPGTLASVPLAIRGTLRTPLPAPKQIAFIRPCSTSAW